MKSQAPRWATPVGLFTALLDHLRRRRIILPAVSLIEHLAWRAYREVEGEALKQLAGSLRPLQRSELDDLLMPAIEAEDHNLLWLRRPIGAPGARGMNDLMDRMDLIRGFELNPAATEGVSPMLLRQLAARGARHPYNTCATTRQKSAWGSSLPFY